MLFSKASLLLGLAFLTATFAAEDKPQGEHDGMKFLADIPRAPEDYEDAMHLKLDHTFGVPHTPEEKFYSSIGREKKDRSAFRQAFPKKDKGQDNVAYEILDNELLKPQENLAAVAAKRSLDSRLKFLPAQLIANIEFVHDDRENFFHF
ncbi:hypothetical protein BZA77DRAFT_292349 [Pyronema omphalodes]|nr:hypothetical protein BZA77DRAFT_292349 [Pyronema omphalodes]